MWLEERTSFVLTIDVEPDDRTYDPSTRPRWLGFEKLLPEMRTFRRLLASATGSAVHFTWLFRLDSQIERTYGRPDWPFEQYRREIDELQAAGDEIGVHTHAWRWEDAVGDWIADHGDAEWVGQCLENSLTAFRRIMGRRARAVSQGDQFLSDGIVRRLSRAGVLCDMSLEPGRALVSQVVAQEHATGSLPDTTRAPRVPYRPSAKDFRQPGVWWPRSLWLLPITTGFVSNPLTGSDAVGCHVLLLGAPFSVVKPVFEGYLAANTLPVVVSKGRSDVMLDAFNGEQLREFLYYLADESQRARLIFETPIDAIQRYQRALAARGYRGREAARFVLSTRFPAVIEQNAPTAPDPVTRPVCEVIDPLRLGQALAAERPPRGLWQSRRSRLAED